MATDKHNNIYLVGQIEGSVDFDPSTGGKNLTAAGLFDIFVAKYKPDGTLLWAESIGDSLEGADGIAVDANGNISIVGDYYGAFDADPGPGVFTMPATGSVNAFLIHLDTNGNFLWAQYFLGAYGGTTGVATDSENNVITATRLGNTQITVGDSIYKPNGADGLIVKYGQSGNVLWSLHLYSKTGQVSPSNPTIDSKDNIIISGVMDSTANFNPLGTAYNLASNPNHYASFVAKYSPSGLLSWVYGINQTAQSVNGRCPITTDQNDNVYFTEAFGGGAVFGADTVMAADSGSSFCFAKFSPTGTVQFARSIGGGTAFESAQVVADRNNNVFIGGYFAGTINFGTYASGPKNLSSNGQGDLFIAEYTQNGDYVYAFNAGNAGCGNTKVAALAIDTNNYLDIAGSFCSSVNFDPTGCSATPLIAASSTQDMFIAQYSTPSISNNTITAPAVTNFCGTATPGTITGSTPTGGIGGYTYQWQSSTDSVTFVNISGANAINYTPTAITTTTYYRRVVSQTCATADSSNIVSFHVGIAPDAPQVAADTVCSGATATLSVESPQTGITYNWYPTATTDTVLFSGTSYTTAVLTGSQTYYVRASSGGGCISAQTAVTVTVLSPLTAPVVTVDSTTASSVTFKWTAVSGATGYLVSTDGGQTFTTPGSGALGLMTTISGLQPNTSVTLIVKAIGIKACQVSDNSAAITASTPPNDLIYVPNAFTPNGDGKNDVVHVHSESIQTMAFYIYDQWGELVFTSNNIQNGWDGTYKGKSEPVGVYVYLLHATMSSGQIITKKGTITLIR